MVYLVSHCIHVVIKFVNHNFTAAQLQNLSSLSFMTPSHMATWIMSGSNPQTARSNGKYITSWVLVPQVL